MNIIDARLRPPTEAFLRSTTDLVPGYGKLFGYELPPSAELRSLERCLQEMDEAEIRLGIAEARWGFDPSLTEPMVTGDDVVEALEKIPGRLLGAVAVSALHVEKSIHIAERYVINGPAVGLSLEMEFSFDLQPALPINAPSLRPLFDFMQEKEIPLFLTGGAVYGSQPPMYLVSMMKTFPKLTVIDLHGHVPYVEQIIHAALNCRNLYLCPDMYGINTHYARPFIDAANGILKERIVYGSAYPFIPLKAARDVYLGYPFKNQEVIDNLMYKNISRALRMDTM